MNILIIADPLEGFDIHHDSTYVMMAEAARRGHVLHAMLARDLAWRDGRVRGRASEIRLLPPLQTGGGGGLADGGQADVAGIPPNPPLEKGGTWFERGAAAWRDLADFDAVLMRTDPPFDQAYLTATWLLEMAERQGARVYNRPGALRDMNEKLSIARFPQFTAPTLVSGDMAEIRDFLREQGDIVVKPLDAMGGAGVFHLHGGDPNLSAILEMSTAHGRRAIMAQRYLPAIAQGDKRILIIDGEAAPWCLARIPASGESRGNLAAGGEGVSRPLTERDREIAEGLGPMLKAEGILLAGIDVIGDCLTEINITSPTCFQEITRQTGFDLGAMFVDALERCVGR